MLKPATRHIPGRTERFSNLPSQHVTPRHVDIWLPAAYDQDPEARFPVLYMHDGQNLFYPELSSIGETWRVAETMDALVQADAIHNCMVVGIWCTGQRFREYCPEKPFRKVPREMKARARMSLGSEQMLSDAYLKFLVEELKPRIDARYRTQAERQSTFIMGSSMGGLISLYALLEYPQVFGGAGCLSTHWPLSHEHLQPDEVAFGFTTVMGEWIRKKLKPGKGHLLYFDHGTETLDAIYEPHQDRIDTVMREAGFSAQEWKSMKFPGHAHTEPDWAARLHHPLRFLLCK